MSKSLWIFRGHIPPRPPPMPRAPEETEIFPCVSPWHMLEQFFWMPIAHVITVLRVRPDGWPSPCCIRAKHPTSLTFSVAVLVSLKSRCYPCENQIGLQIHVELRASDHFRGSCVSMVAACCLPTSEVEKLLDRAALISCAGIVLLSETHSWVHLPTFGKFACL